MKSAEEWYEWTRKQAGTVYTTDLIRAVQADAIEAAEREAMAIMTRLNTDYRHEIAAAIRRLGGH